MPTNYTISTYAKLGLIDPLDLSKLPNYDAEDGEPRFTSEGMIDGKTYAVPKNWGTTGIAVNTGKLKTPVTSWKEFFEVAQTEADGRAMVHDYQLTTIGNALVSLGYSFNSVDPAELAKAEELLIKVKPHLFAINSDYQPAMRATDAWMTMCWTNDGAQLNRDMPEIAFMLGKDGGEIWSDFYAIPTSAREQGRRLCAARTILMDSGERGQGTHRQRRADDRQPRARAAARGSHRATRSSIRTKPR